MVLTEEQKQRFTTGFNSLDTDRSGYVTVSDYEAKAESLAVLKGYTLGSPEHNAIRSQFLSIWNELQKAVDKDSDQKVNLDEFLKFAEQTSSQSDLVENIFVKGGDLVFDLADSDGDGAINFDESKPYFLLFESNLGLAAKTFAAIDRDGDGVISKEENRQLIRNSYSS